MKNETKDLANIDLINHVWKKCISSKDGKALFHGDTLAQTYLSEDDDWTDSFAILRDCPELSINAFYIDGLREKIFEVTIPLFCTTKEYKELADATSREAFDFLQGGTSKLFGHNEMTVEEAIRFKKKFYKDLLDQVNP